MVDSLEWVQVTMVCASPLACFRCLIWDPLIALDPGEEVPWILGDVNAILSCQERFGGSSRSDRCPLLLRSTFECSLEQNLASFQQQVSAWNREVFGHIGSRKRVLVARLHGVEKALQQRHSASLIKLERRLKVDLDKNLFSVDTVSHGEYRIRGLFPRLDLSGNQLANSMAKLDWLDDFIGHRFLAPPESVLQRLEEERGGMSFDAG
ncbi:hypothetical protein V6N13_046384 [Hibiscus sabdariffa]